MVHTILIVLLIEVVVIVVGVKLIIDLSVLSVVLSGVTTSALIAVFVGQNCLIIPGGGFLNWLIWFLIFGALVLALRQFSLVSRYVYALTTGFIALAVIKLLANLVITVGAGIFSQDWGSSLVMEILIRLASIGLSVFAFLRDDFTFRLPSLSRFLMPVQCIVAAPLGGLMLCVWFSIGLGDVVEVSRLAANIILGVSTVLFLIFNFTVGRKME